ncbi:hypothetical protein ACP70R_036665 [Stipagrostis hirtigluma subsp. patula]
MRVLPPEQRRRSVSPRRRWAPINAAPPRRSPSPFPAAPSRGSLPRGFVKLREKAGRSRRRRGAFYPSVMDFALGPLDCIGMMRSPVEPTYRNLPHGQEGFRDCSHRSCQQACILLLDYPFPLCQLDMLCCEDGDIPGGISGAMEIKIQLLDSNRDIAPLVQTACFVTAPVSKTEGLFIAGVAGSIFYSATAIVAMIYCDSTLVFDLMGIALTITMNVMGFINQDPYHMDIDHSTLWVSVMGAISAIVSCFTSRYGDTTCLPVLIASITSAVFKVLDVLLRLTCPYCGSARDLINYFLSRLHEIFE